MTKPLYIIAIEAKARELKNIYANSMMNEINPFNSQAKHVLISELEARKAEIICWRLEFNERFTEEDEKRIEKRITSLKAQISELRENQTCS